MFWRNRPSRGGFANADPSAHVAPDAIVAADDGIYWTNNIAAGGVYQLAK